MAMQTFDSMLRQLQPPANKLSAPQRSVPLTMLQNVHRASAKLLENHGSRCIRLQDITTHSACPTTSGAEQY